MKLFSLIFYLLILVSATLPLYSFAQTQNIKPQVDQKMVCMITEVDDAIVDKCPGNKLIFYAPKENISEQMPIIFVAAYCNTNYQIIYNKIGVLCVRAEKIDRLKPA